MTNAAIIPPQQPAPSAPATTVTRADVYAQIPAMLRMCQHNPAETKAITNSVRVLEISGWYMEDNDTMIMKSESDPQKQYRISSRAGCNCKAGRPCQIRRQKCRSCTSGSHDTECLITRPCKHRAAFELVRRAIRLKQQAAQQAAQRRTYTQEERDQIQAERDRIQKEADELF